MEVGGSHPPSFRSSLHPQRAQSHQDPSKARARHMRKWMAEVFPSVAGLFPSKIAIFLDSEFSNLSPQPPHLEAMTGVLEWGGAFLPGQKWRKDNVI